MSTLEFIAELSRAFAWPMAAVVVALLFKGQIKALFARAKGSLIFGPVSATWDDQFQEVTSDASKVIDSTPPRSFEGGMIDDLMNLYKQFPEAAIVLAYKRVEQAIFDKLGRDFGSRPLGSKLAKVALEQGLVTEETARAIDGLRNLRNLAAHGTADELGAERVLDYLVLVDAVLYAIGNKQNP